LNFTGLKDKELKGRRVKSLRVNGIQLLGKKLCSSRVIKIKRNEQREGKIKKKIVKVRG